MLCAVRDGMLAVDSIAYLDFDGGAEHHKRKETGMSEYIVKWRHLRRVFGNRHLMTAQEARECGFPLRPRGGKTECRIYERVDAPEGGSRGALKSVAHAKVVCSKTDQFDRRAGRLYSLAYALCDWDAPWKTVLSIMEQYLPTGPAGAQTEGWYTMSAGIQTHDRCLVTLGCNFVATWRKPKTERVADVRELYRTAMKACEQYGRLADDCLQHAFEQAAHRLNACDELVEAMVTPMLAGDKRETAEICAQIVKEWHGA